MKSVLLRLAGPLQSWGTQGRFGIRDTDTEPSKSGVLGLVGAALGMQREDEATLARLRTLQMAVRVDREGSPLRDYHTVGGGRFRGGAYGLWSVEAGKLEEKTALTQRYYLCDASFLVALGNRDRALIEQIAEALQRPVWPLFLGRRSCAPAEQVYAGVCDAGPTDAVRRVAMTERDRAEAPERLRIVVESEADGGRPRQDDPLAFHRYARRHGLRHVRYDFIDRNTLPEAAP
jgi:CRISPR system Cascade subunit CasD